VIVLRPWAYDWAFVVIVVLIADIPIESLVQLNSEPCLRRLITHRIRSDQRSWSSGRIGDSISLTIIFVDPVRRKQRHSRRDSGNGFYKEEVVSDEIQTVALWVRNAIEEIVENRVVVDPVIVVAGADRESRSRGPIERRAEDFRLYAHPEIFQRYSGDLRRIGVVFGDEREVESESRGWFVSALRTNVGVVVITDACKHVVCRSVFPVEVEVPIL